MSGLAKLMCMSPRGKACEICRSKLTVKCPQCTLPMCQSCMSGDSCIACTEKTTDPEDEQVEDEKVAQLPPVKETDAMTRRRRATLERYKQVLENLDENTNYSFKERSQRSEIDSSAKRIQNAVTLKATFFQHVKKDENYAQLDLNWHESDAYAELVKKRASVGQSAAGEEFDYTLMDQDLKATLDAVYSSSMELGERTKLHETIASSRQSLVKNQQSSINEGKTKIKSLVESFRKHRMKLTSELASKSKENYSATTPSGRRKRDLFRKVKTNSSKHILTPAGKAEQEIFEEELKALKSELNLVSRYYYRLKVEQYFPKCLQYKFRINAGDGVFIGLRDIEIGHVTSRFHAEKHKSDCFKVHVTNIAASIGILDLSIRGSSAKAKMFQSILVSSTIGRLDVDVTGSWTLVLRFDEKRQKWVENREGSVFKLTIARKTTGFSTMLLPQQLLQTLSNGLLPKLITGALRTVLPPHIGQILIHAGNVASISGDLEIKGEMSPGVWREPLVGPTSLAAKARHALNLTEEEAVALDFICRTSGATSAGFHQKAISLGRLYKWRLQFSMYHVIELEPMLQMVQDTAGLGMPNGWLFQMVAGVTLLARKPIDCWVNVTHFKVDLDLSHVIDASTDMYLASYRTAKNLTSAQKLRDTAKKDLAAAEKTVTAISHIIHRVVTPLVNSMVKCVANTMLIGGVNSGGFLAVSLKHIDAHVKMPDLFSATAVLPKGDEVRLNVIGKSGPRLDEYTFKISEKGSDNEGADSEISIRNTVLSLFPSGSAPGSVKLDASEVRASLLLPVLDTAFHSLGSQANNDVVPSNNGFLFPETGNLIHNAKDAVEMLEGPLEHAEKDTTAKIKVLPKYLTDDEYDFKFDMRGLATEFRKVSVDGVDTLRVSVSNNGDLLSSVKKSCAFFHIRVYLRDLFEDFA